ncbi:hypothetical protein [Croceibacter atlanticus]|uniref:hypothetical protein n=1 Tax=Croceibacter atlanticus TaxID=313588 RepID=UPI0030F51DF3
MKLNKFHHILLPLILVTVLWSCKTEQKDYEYSFNNYPDRFICDSLDTKLIKEAFYSYEEDIYYYNNDPKKKNLMKAMAKWINHAIKEKVTPEQIISERTVTLFKMLKKKHPEFWIKNQGEMTLNLDSPFMTCVFNNIDDNNVKTTFLALKDTNTFKPELVEPLLTGNYSRLAIDPYLNHYAVFQYGFGRMFNKDLTTIKD